MRILPAANFALPLVVLILNCFLRGVPSLPLTTEDLLADITRDVELKQPDGGATRTGGIAASYWSDKLVTVRLHDLVVQSELQTTTLDAVNASGSNSGMVIGIAAGCVSFGFMLLFLLFRWWWRTPHHKQPWGVDLQQKRRSVAQQRSPAQALGPQLSFPPRSPFFFLLLLPPFSRTSLLSQPPIMSSSSSFPVRL